MIPQTSGPTKRWPFAISKGWFLCATFMVLGGNARAIEKSVITPCRVNGPVLAQNTSDDSINANVMVDYKTAVQAWLVAEKFNDLDCIADSVRHVKATFASGVWKLHVLYAGLDQPQGHATEEDWNAHLDRLNRWISANPDSATATIALAKSYVSYAWDARGDGYADTVTDSGWRLFSQRINKAKEILDKASILRNECPEWYVVMQQVALAQSWDMPKEGALLEQAISFEPRYDFYYRMQATYLLPRWQGQDGDPERFAQESADKIGGTQGDILYFHIVESLSCNCDTELKLSRMAWPRIQRGAGALEKQNGVSLQNLNELAYMATKIHEPEVAQSLFLRIGDSWEKEVWKKKAYFDSCKAWAANNSQSKDRFNSFRELANSNMQNSGRSQIRKRA